MSYKYPDEESYKIKVKQFKDLLWSIVPTATASVGSVLYEWIIRPLGIASASAEKSLEELADTYTLKYLSTSTNTEEGAADAILSNYFITRRSGTNARGVITIISSTPTTVVPDGSTFTVGDVTVSTAKAFCGVYPSTDGYVSTDTMTYVKAIKSGNSYAFNVEVFTATASNAVIPEGTPATAGSYISGVTEAYLGSAIAGGSDTETDAEMVSRASTTVASSFGGSKAVQKILDNSGYPVYSSVSFGQSDPEMLRDEYNALLLGTGGMVDTYVKTSQYPLSGSVSVTLTKDGSYYKADLTDILPKGFLAVSGVGYPSGVSGSFSISWGSSSSSTKAVSGDVPVDSPEGARFSAYQTAALSVQVEGTTENSIEVLVNYTYMPYIEELQEYMDGSDVKMVGTDIRIKSAIPAVVRLGAACSYSGTTPEDVAPLVQQFINSTAVGLQELNAADIQDFITNTLPGTYMRNPIQMQVTTTNYDGVSVSSTESDSGLVSVSVEDGVTTGRMRFFCIGSTEINLR